MSLPLQNKDLVSPEIRQQNTHKLLEVLTKWREKFDKLQDVMGASFYAGKNDKALKELERFSMSFSRPPCDFFPCEREGMEKMAELFREIVDFFRFLMLKYPCIKDLRVIHVKCQNFLLHFHSEYADQTYYPPRISGTKEREYSKKASQLLGIERQLENLLEENLMNGVRDFDFPLRFSFSMDMSNSEKSELDAFLGADLWLVRGNTFLGELEESKDVFSSQKKIEIMGRLLHELKGIKDEILKKAADLKKQLNSAGSLKKQADRKRFEKLFDRYTEYMETLNQVVNEILKIWDEVFPEGEKKKWIKHFEVKVK